MRKINLPRAALSASLAIAILVAPGIHIAHAQYAATAAGSGTMPFSFLSSGPLAMGSRGADVAGLQGFLSELGYLNVPSGTALGYFGSMTKNSLMRYQQSIGASATGEFDASTRAATATYLSSRFPQLSFSWSGIGQTGTSTLASNAPTVNGRPLSSTGYWYNGNWYNSIPTGNDSGVTGYWLNGTWVPVSSNGSNANSSGSIASNGSNAANGNTGYWYNGVWYPVSSTQGGGYYSSNPSVASNGSSSAGYWYNGVWYPTNSANVGGGQSSDVTSSGGTNSTNSSNNTSGAVSGTGYWLNGLWYSTSSNGQTGSSINSSTGSNQTQNGINYSTNLTPTGYWQNGVWYATTPTASQAQSAGIPGYWQNNVWYSTDGSQTTIYGTPNPTNPNSGSGYWQNGVWYSTNTTVNSSNNTSGANI